jgi:hypothetical protein
MSNCIHCGEPEGNCYRICPSQDPYGGNQAAEAADHDFNARYDDVRERYAGDIDPEYELWCADQDMREHDDFPEIPDEYKQPGGVRLSGLWQGRTPSTDDYFDDDSIPF